LLAVRRGCSFNSLGWRREGLMVATPLKDVLIRSRPESCFRRPSGLIVFRRPRLTERVLSAIHAVRPRKLFVIADGPRPIGQMT
jgi:hypothetical protein